MDGTAGASVGFSFDLRYSDVSDGRPYLKKNCETLSERSSKAAGMPLLHFLLQRIDQGPRFVCHLEELRPGAMIIFSGQFAGGIKAHV